MSLILVQARRRKGQVQPKTYLLLRRSCPLIFFWDDTWHHRFVYAPSSCACVVFSYTCLQMKSWHEFSFFSSLFHMMEHRNDSPALFHFSPRLIRSNILLVCFASCLALRLPMPLVIPQAAFGNPATTLIGPPPRWVRFFLFPREAFLLRPCGAFLLVMVRWLFNLVLTRVRVIPCLFIT